MDQTPTRASRLRNAEVRVLDEEEPQIQDGVQGGRIRKPPPITPRRFNKFFTPRPRNATQAVKTSRRALRTISSSNLNTRRHPALLQDVPEDYVPANENQNSRKKRKYSLISSAQSTPPARSVSFLPSSQDPIPSSPIKYGRDVTEAYVDLDSDVSTDIDEDAWSGDDDEPPPGPRITPYKQASTSTSLFASRLTGRRRIHIAESSDLWQSETANFYSNPGDINADLRARHTPIIPFSLSACHTNPVVATGDEEGVIRFLNTADADKGTEGFGKTVLSFQPHDNAVMDLTFSSDDNFIATASGDQTCQIVDVQAKRSLYSLRAHTASVKRIEFQPGSGSKILASAGRDGTICLWDLRVKGQPLGGGRRARLHVTEMAEELSVLAPVLEIYDAHNPKPKNKNASQKTKQSTIAGRSDFSITSLSFLDSSRSHLLASASEVDTVIKLWDVRQSQISARRKGHSQLPVSMTEEPRSHEIHRKFGINSLALSTDSSRLFALSRDHTVYAYSTSHLILGSSPEMIRGSSVSRNTLAPMRTESCTGLGPLYGLRHPSLRVATFWPRLDVRKCNDSNSEVLAVASTDDCTVLFPTSEKYHTASARTIPSLHNPTTKANASGPTSVAQNDAVSASRPSISRAPTSSFTSLFTRQRQEEDNLPIYYHGTPLVHGHNKEVTSVVWSWEGNLVTASDDFYLRCWRENVEQARQLRGLSKKKDAASLLQKGWADVGVDGWDDED